MKSLVKIVLSVILVIVSSWAHAMDINVQTGLSTNWWDSDSDERGNQTYMPVTIDGVHGDFSMQVLSAFVSTRIDPSDASKDSLTTAVDTKLNFSYAVVDRFPVDVLFGLDFNLPTGKTDLDTKEGLFLLDPDLVDISRYGEGFNVNPTLTMARQEERWGLGVGLGYLWRGEYDYSDTAQDYDPGDIFNITAEGFYVFTDVWLGRIFGEMAFYGTDEMENQNYYQEGDFILAGIGLDYFKGKWEASLSGQGIFRGKCQFQAENLQLATEDRAGYGDEYLADLTVKFSMSPEIAFSSRLYYLMVLKNDYEDDDPSFIDEKEKISLNVSLHHQFSEDFSGRIGLEGYLLDEGRNWYHEEDREYRGMIMDIAVSKAF